MGKFDLTEEEATPLVINDLEEGVQEKWLIAGKVLHRKILHIQTNANALRPAWGNPRGLTFKPGERTYSWWSSRIVVIVIACDMVLRGPLSGMQ